ncbi:FMN-linked oxidoreductase [Hortaea werneckii]|uniref:tRNA-dihydrouridine(16/17) synthase [NAD(P)(+)] n=1 Tax=Hortaea werneckii TaxID=91943 RepID=A0A3M7J2I6_HORWE|nr:FMN-linked oxidoreductase [Hortaea werneckii]KAI6927527.1 FMN-linked oxidoreductase [Hortaea werneckii]KAI6984205.1 FMN-linked oxidoreductase [Hortaea werneckii]KAI7038146.1 FMN-linked oxidoreductase [Hortaea werneckii]KAI7273040.1 FMN-linked oxidoreductase [Hortaea werneckii]
MANQKLHGRAFYESIGSPKYIVAPMVDQSEFAWRLLTRSFLPPELRRSVLCYSPMFHAKLFAESHRYRTQHFEPLKPAHGLLPQSPQPPPFEGVEAEKAYLDGHPENDRPLFVQFCANDPDHYLAAAKHVQPYCEAVDLNLGCPQGIAKRGNYGAFLQEDWDTIYKLINKLHRELDIPVTAKIRVQETREKTLEYAKMILSAGASCLTVHGRRREMKGHATGLADWTMIRYLREQLPPDTVIFANGNILQHDDIQDCLDATGADAVMSAEGNLYDPSIFAKAPPVGQEGTDYWRGRDGKGGYRMDAVLRRYLDIIHEHVLQQEPPAREPLFLPSDQPATEPQKSAEEPSAPPQSTDAASVEDAKAPEPQTGDKRAAPDNAEWTRESKASKRQRKREAKNAAKQHTQQKKGKVDDALKYEPNMVAMQSHCFHMLRPLVSKHHNVRDALARTRSGDIEAYEEVLRLTQEAVKIGLLDYAQNPQAYEDVVVESNGEVRDGTESSDEAVRRCKRPYWVCQPYVRPLPKEALEKGSLQLSKKDLRKLQEDEEARKNGTSAVQANGEANSAANGDANDDAKGEANCGASTVTAEKAAKEDEQQAVESGLPPGGKTEEVGPKVKKEVNLPAEAGDAEKEGTLKVPKEGMIDDLILSSKLLSNGAYLTPQLNAPCGDLGGFWDERKEWQVLGIAVCKKLRIRERIREQVSFAAEKESAVRRMAACTLSISVTTANRDGFEGLTLRALMYERDFAPDATPEAKKEWRGIASKLRRRFYLSARLESGNTKRKPAVQVESVIQPETPTKSSQMLLKADEYMPPGIAHMRTLYKEAGQKLTEYLYEAAKSHCRISAYMFDVEREYTPYYQYDDGSTRRTIHETLYLPKNVDAYRNVATVVAEKAPEKITRDMLILLRKEIAGRRIVDAWHNELLDGSPRKNGLRVHQNFTEGLETIYPILQKVVIARSDEKGKGGKDTSLALPDPMQPNLSGTTAFDCDWRSGVKQLEYHAGVMRKKRDVLGDTQRLEALLELPCWAVCYI